jgi:signal transduction histidine kinase
MTLRRRLILNNLILIGSLALLAAVSMLGLASLRSDAQVAVDEYQELRISQDIRNRLSVITSRCETSGVLPASQDLRSSIDELNKFSNIQDTDQDEPHEHNMQEKHGAVIARGELQKLCEELDSPAGTSPKEVVQRLSVAMQQVNHVSEISDRMIKQTQRTAGRWLRDTMITVGAISFFIVIGACVVSIKLSQSVLRPLRRLQAGVRRLAQARFSDRLTIQGDTEFLELADDFNRMAAELDGFYRRLEEMVATKSRELVRSERLASVGFLAAGVAHEINNPLGIISGHAELLERRLRNCTDPAVTDKARQALAAIRSEAFRCKQITDRLLSMARKDTTARKTVSLAQAVNDIEMLIRGLKPLRNRTLHSRLDADREPLEVTANITEMKQVLLNLIINALQAVDDYRGEVIIDGRRDNAQIVLTITDNGRGIPPDAIEHIFEPFFTDKRGATAPGTGLGLSITHAIVTDHGGSITAASDGPGKGSCFTLRLPAAAPQPPSEDTAPQPVAALAGGTEVQT